MSSLGSKSRPESEGVLEVVATSNDDDYLEWDFAFLQRSERCEIIKLLFVFATFCSNGQ